MQLHCSAQSVYEIPDDNYLLYMKNELELVGGGRNSAMII